MRAHRTLQICFPLVLIFAAFAISCGSPQTATLDESRFLQIEKDPGGGSPSREAAGLREAALIKDDSVTVAEQTKEPNCPFTVSTFVRKETGTDCNSYRAEIAGSSTKCVKECDDKARLAEAVASAQLTCADFCKKKKCPGPRYQPPEKCATTLCDESASCEAKECPKVNQCTLLQAQRVWNCICLET